MIAGMRRAKASMAVKMRTRSFNAFSSIDYPELAVIREGRVIPYIETPKPASPVFYREMNRRVFVLRLVPGQDGAAGQSANSTPHISAFFGPLATGVCSGKIG